MPRISVDKILHFLAGFMIVMAVAWFSNVFVGFAVSIMIGLVKEFYDGATGRGMPECMDFAATACGAGAAMVGFLLVFGVPSI